MAVKAGDIVRFLNTTGGGIVTRKDGQLVYVEDEDGFEIPIMVNEVVVIEQKNEKQKQEQPEKDLVPEDDYKYEETGDDDDPCFYVAILAGEESGSESGSVRIAIVNDTNYFAQYVIADVLNDDESSVLFVGTIEPNTKLPLDKKSLLQLDDKKWRIQLNFYKRDKAFKYLPSVCTELKLKASRFLKENSFMVNDYFHESAVLLPVIKKEFDKKLEQLTDQQINQVIQEKEKKPVRKTYAKRNEPGILEVDLHIHELVDSVKGLSNSEMLEIQMNRFKHVMEENKQNRGRKLVFIHGVGNGTLKTEIRKTLDRQYKKHNYQDASFQEYGYGATMVII